MPGYIMHMACAHKVYRHMNNLGLIDWTENEKNNFIVGTILPDIYKNKQKTHFRTRNAEVQYLRYAHTELFVQKYQKILSDPCCLGYCCHLFLDTYYTKSCLSKAIQCLDANQNKEERINMIQWVRLNNYHKIIPYKDFMTEKYYYGDFNKLNEYIKQKYLISTELNFQLINPGIDEVNFEDFPQLISNFYQCVMKKSILSINDLKVFELNDIIECINDAAKKFTEYFEQQMVKNH